MKTFVQAWKEQGRIYGRDELENVRLGWEMCMAAWRDARELPPITIVMPQPQIAVLLCYCDKPLTPEPCPDCGWSKL